MRVGSVILCGYGIWIIPLKVRSENDIHFVAVKCSDMEVNGMASKYPNQVAYPNEVTVVCNPFLQTSLATNNYQAQCQMDGTWLHYDLCMSMGFSIFGLACNT